MYQVHQEKHVPINRCWGKYVKKKLHGLLLYTSTIFVLIMLNVEYVLLLYVRAYSRTRPQLIFWRRSPVFFFFFFHPPRKNNVFGLLSKIRSVMYNKRNMYQVDGENM